MMAGMKLEGAVGLLAVAFAVAGCSCSSETSATAAGGTAAGAAGAAAGGATGGSGGHSGGGGTSTGGNGGVCDVCNSTIGLCQPMPTCTVQDPCTNLLSTYPVDELTEPTAIPDCGADAPPVAWMDPVDNIIRYACESRPPGTSPTSTRPLLIYIHGSGGNADTLHLVTTLRDKAPTYDLTGEPLRPGFITVSTQGRNLHWPSSDPQDGSKHDTFHRDFSTNRDVAFVDAQIDRLVTEGVVDTQRIYIMGWSNGARFAGMYGIERHVNGTAMGSRIAAVANYSGGDPYENTTHDQMPSCKLATYPSSPVPFMLVSRTCDIIACDQAQADGFATPPNPGNIASNWIDDLENVIGADVTWLGITGIGTQLNICTPTCGIGVAILNHVRWPNGIPDMSGNDYEIDMLDFLRNSPLP